MLGRTCFLSAMSMALWPACGSGDGLEGPAVVAERAACGTCSEDGVPGSLPTAKVTYASDVEPIRRASDAQPAVFIPPFEDCRPARGGEAAGQGPEGKVCTNVSIAGCTEEGRYYPDYADCEVVRTQRPFWPAPPAGETRADDPRLSDPAYMDELAWVTEQARASACTCCHDTKIQPSAAQWDLNSAPIWTDTASDSAIALFSGLADSSVFGAYSPEQNNGFDRTLVGLPSTDPGRMRTFFLKELARRGLTEADARAVPPFGGPLYRMSVAAPTPCSAEEGVDSQGRIRWSGSTGARYVYLLTPGSRNPGVPPNLDKPEGTIWRLDVSPNAAPLQSGQVRYGTTPEGTYQSLPAASSAPTLEEGRTYQLFVNYDVGFALANCLFTYERQ